MKKNMCDVFLHVYRAWKVNGGLEGPLWLSLSTSVMKKKF